MSDRAVPRSATPGQRLVLILAMVCMVSLICLVGSLLITASVAPPPSTGVLKPIAGRPTQAPSHEPPPPADGPMTTEQLMHEADRWVRVLIAPPPATAPTSGAVMRMAPALDGAARVRAIGAIDRLLQQADQPYSRPALHLRYIEITALVRAQAPEDVIVPRVDDMVTHAPADDRGFVIDMLLEVFARGQARGLVNHLAGLVAHDQTLDAATRQRVQTVAETSRVVIGAPFPNFALTDLAGTVHRLGSYQGHLLVVHLWSSHSPPCVRMTPDLVRLERTYRDQGVAFLGIDGDGGIRPHQGLLAQFSWPQVDATTAFGHVPVPPWGVRTLPWWFLIGPDGTLVGRGETVAALEGAIMAHLPQRPPGR